MKKQNVLLKTILSALFLAMAYVFPFLTGQIPEIGSMLCPMHIPVLICGFICGAQWGLVVGFSAPLLRSFFLTMPPFFPKAICMAFELAVYGLVAGILRKKLPQKKIYIYVSLLVSMIIGRIVWGIAMFVCLGTSSFTFGDFISGAITTALPGIAIQIIFVPLLVMILESPKVLKLKQ